MEATSRPLRERAITRVWLLAATAGLLVQLGYAFESNDQVQYLLLPYREIYPDFLPGDWFTWSTSHYHLTFAWIVRALHAAFGESSFRLGVFAAHCATLGWLAHALLRISRSVGGGVIEATLPVLVFACARELGIGGAIVNHGCLLPSDLALPPFLLACATCLERRAIASGVWLGVAGFLHANFAVLGPVVVLPILAAQRWPQLRAAGPERAAALRELLIATGVYSVIAAPSLVLLASSFVARDADPGAIAITLFVRSPHHYDLAYMLATDFYWTGLIVLLATPAVFGRAHARHGVAQIVPERASVVGLCALLALLIAIGLLGAGLHIVPLARLFTLRMSIPLIAICLILFARVARAALSTREPGAWAWVFAGVSVLAMFVREDITALQPFSDPPYVADPSAPGFPIWLYAGVLLPLALATAALRVLPSRRTLAIAALAAIPLLLSLWVARIPLGPMWTGARVRPARSFHFMDRRIVLEAPDRDLYAKARLMTPNDARFLIAPGLFEFRMRARRGVFVDWKCAPMKGDEASEWKRRMLAAIGTTDFPAHGYALPLRADALYYARPLGELVELAKREGLTHVVVRKQQLGRDSGAASLAFTSGPYAVLRVL